MKKFFLFMLFVLLGVSGLKARARYFTSLEALLERKDSVIFTDAKLDDAHYYGIFEVQTQDKALRRDLQNRARLVFYTGKLYINLRGLKCERFRFGRYFVEAKMLGDSTVFFVAPEVGSKAFRRRMGIAAALSPFTLGLSFLTVFGRVGHESDLWCPYVYTLDSRNPVKVDRDYLLRLLSQINPYLFFEYKSLPRNQQNDVSVIESYMLCLCEDGNKIR